MGLGDESFIVALNVCVGLLSTYLLTILIPWCTWGIGRLSRNPSMLLVIGGAVLVLSMGLDSVYYGIARFLLHTTGERVNLWQDGWIGPITFLRTLPLLGMLIFAAGCWRVLDQADTAVAMRQLARAAITLTAAWACVVWVLR